MALFFLQKLIFSFRAQAVVRTIGLLGCLAIFFASAAFIVVLSVMNGMNLSMQKRIVALEPHAVVWTDSKSDRSVPDFQDPLLKVQDLPVYEWAKRQRDWTVHPFSIQDVMLRSNDGKFQGAEARGVTSASLLNFERQLQAMGGRGTTPVHREELGEGQVYLGSDLARALQVLEGDEVSVVSPEGLLLPPGEAPLIERVTVAGILETNLPDLDSHLVMFESGKTLDRLRNSRSLRAGIEIWFPKLSDSEANLKELRSLFQERIESWRDRNADLFFALSLEKSLIGLVLGFAGLISGSAIVTVLAILISHKRRDIAIMRTLGLNNRETIRLFTKMGFMISGGSLGLGVLLGSLISLYIEAYPLHILPSIYYDSSIPAEFRWELVAGVLVVGGFLSWAGSYLPARAASVILPATSLKLKR